MTMRNQSPTPTEAADQAEITQLTIDYCWALDTGDWETLRRIFTPDVVAFLGGKEHIGIDAVIEKCSGALGPLDDSQHLISTHQIHVDGDTATSRCYLHAQHIRAVEGGSPLYVVAGRYEDQLIRGAHGWRIAARSLIVMWTDGNPEVVRKAD